METAITKVTDTGAGSMSERPIQILPWAEKNEDWFIKNVNYYIGRSNFNFGKDTGRKDLSTLYGVYNNEFPLDWFTHITNPLNARDPKHKRFPAKVRPVTILRTNIDLLLGEWPRRPYVYNVENNGESGYNSYLDGMSQAAKKNMMAHFTQAALESAQAGGRQLTPEEIQQLQQDPPTPDDVKADYQASYKDAIAIKGQKWLKRIIREQEVKRKQHKMFKDWLIAGQAYSYKAIENDTLVYRKISPMCIDFDKSMHQDYIEDGEWVVYKDWFTLSEVVDRFYATLSKEQHEDLAKGQFYSSPNAFYNYLSTLGNIDQHGKIPVFHVQWKGRKKIGFLSYLDMETFQLVEDIVDEDYVIDREKGEQVEWRYVNEVYEGWRIGEQVYTQMQPSPIQRNEMNNHSTCKLSYNGRKYSDTHAENISVLEFGIPFQIMYIIVTYTLEKTIAKSKGKLLLIDQNAIPDDEDWDEEKFFYYSEALGYALLNRNQVGVDKSWNQYQVLDMSLFDSIKQLIELQAYFKQQWDDVIGISRQRKGETMASDGQGVNERSVFQSTVITDMIFIGFEELCERELQGLMDLAKFATSKGVYGTYNDDDYGTQLLEIMPEDFMLEELGVFVDGSSEIQRKLGEMKQYAQAMLQNGHKASTVLEIVDAENIADLKAKLRLIEQIDAQVEAQNQDAELQAEQHADERKMKFMEYEKLLEREYMEAEMDRKDDQIFLKGTFDTFTFKDGDSNANGIPDAAEVAKLNNDRQKLMNDHDNKVADRTQRTEQLSQKKREFEHKVKMDKEDVKIKKDKVKIDRKKASRPTSK